MRGNGIRGSREQAEALSRENGEVGNSRHGKARAREEQLESEETVEVEKANLVAEKQAELETVLDSHDTLVREMFHMDHFVMMIGYDPAEAKKDDTKVFRNYKAMYDLVEKAVPDPGPSRATRRNRTEQVQLLTAPSVSAPCTSTTSRTKLKEASGHLTHTRIKDRTDLEDPHTTGSQASVSEQQQSKHAIEDSASYVLSDWDKRRKTRGVDLHHTPPTKKRRVILSHPGEGSTIVARKSERLKLPMAAPGVAVPSACIDVENLSVTASAPISSQSRDAQKRLSITSGPSPSPKFNIKRVKLLVRRPPPPITNPQQRPPNTKHNSSVHTFLSSYLTFDDKDIDERTLDQKVRDDAQLLERVEKLKEQGRFLPDHEVVSSPVIDATEFKPRSEDHWDHVIEAACRISKHWAKRTSGQQVASHVAKLIRGYWDGQEARKEKSKIQEERRLRTLAKATIRIVTDEWKKAVFHIREQERLKLEAEEVRRGREHLDAILDQSGQLLETQQGDLTRGDISRSRSGSLSHDWASGDDDNSQEAEDTDAGSIAGESLDEQETDEEEPELVELPMEETDLDASTSYDSESDVDVPLDAQGGSNTRLLLGDFSASAHPETGRGRSDNSSPPLEAYVLDGRAHSVESLDGVVEDSMNDLVGGSPPPTSLDVSGSGTAVLEPVIRTWNSSRRVSPDIVMDSFHSTSSQSVDDEIVERDSSSERQTPSSPRSPGRLALLARSVSDSPTPELQASPKPAQLSETATPGGFSSGMFEDLSSVPSEKRPSDLKTNVTSPSLLPPTEVDESSTPVTIVAPNPALLEPQESTEAGILSIQEDPEDEISTPDIPDYLKPFAVAPVEWDLDAKIIPPLLLRGILRPYQQSGLEWLASLHTNNLNGILADEMGLGKTIQTIALLAHLACDRGIWGPHLIVVPTSVLLNWEMEFKKFLPGFKVLSYHGGTKRRKELRQGWNDRHHFNAWYYMILDEAHMIKNFKSQRWNLLLMFRSFRRLLLTGTPLQNNLTELWALLQFLMSGTNFATLKDFGDWFSNPLEKAIEMGNAYDEDTMQRVSKLHTVLRPYLLRRLKSDVEKELPSKYEHLVLCPLSKRQRFLYDEFMARSHTRDALQSGVYQKIANVLMQLRKVCNHPDLFEVRPIVTSFAMERSAIADFEIKELLIRRRLMDTTDDTINFGLLGLRFVDNQDQSLMTALETRRLDASSLLTFSSESCGEEPPRDFQTVPGFRKFSVYMQQASAIARWSHIRYLNTLRCKTCPMYSSELLSLANRLHNPIMPVSSLNSQHPNWEAIRIVNTMIKSYDSRAEEMADVVDKFAFVTPSAVALDLPRFTFSGCQTLLTSQSYTFDSALHRASVKLQIAFPDPSLLQYDCGKLQELTRLLREKKAGGHRILIFTQMTKILDILEIFLNYHGYLYLRLDGATKIEDRQYITERFNADPRVFCFIASSRSGGVGINLTGADTVVFYDSDFNPQMDRQCEDRAHRIGQIRDVHIYRFVSQHTVEEALLRKANQKRSLDDLVIQRGEFDWRSLFSDQGALSKALEEFEDTEDAHAAAVAATEEVAMQGADEADFGGDVGETATALGIDNAQEDLNSPRPNTGDDMQNDEAQAEDDGGSVVEYMINFVQQNREFFKEWRL